MHWFTLDDLNRRRRTLRSPVVTRCIEDHVAGRRKPESLLDGLLPVQQNVERVIASASLV